MASLVNVNFPIENMDTPEFIEALNNAGGVTGISLLGEYEGAHTLQL
jgi:hypothetical protein